MKRDNSIYLDIINNIKTVQDINMLTQEIDDFTQAIFEMKKTSIEGIFNSVSAEFASKIIKAFSKNNLNINDASLMIDFLKTLREVIHKLKTIKITLAFDPNQATIERLFVFIKENLGHRYILDIESSSEILGGAIISFEGKYSDGSLKKSIEDVFAKENRGTIGLVGQFKNE